MSCHRSIYFTLTLLCLSGRSTVMHLSAHIAQLVLPHISKGQLIQSFITGQHHSITVINAIPALAFNYTSRTKYYQTGI